MHAQHAACRVSADLETAVIRTCCGQWQTCSTYNVSVSLHAYTSILVLMYRRDRPCGNNLPPPVCQETHLLITEQHLCSQSKPSAKSSPFCCRSNATCAPRLDMTVVEFAHWWKMHKAGQDDRLLYLKDWHFAHAFPNYKAYETPLYFQDDWLNDFNDMEQAGTQQSDQVNLQQQPCTTAADLCSTAVAPTSVESNSTAAGLECRSVGRDDGDCSMAAGAISGIPYLRRSHGAHDMSTNFPPQGAVIKQDTDNKREAVGSHDEEAGGHGSRAACETLSSDYRFVYLGCKVWHSLNGYSCFQTASCLESSSNQMMHSCWFEPWTIGNAHSA